MRVGIRAAVAALLLVLFYSLLGAVTWFGVLIVRRAITDPTYAGGQRVFIGIFGMFFLVPAIRVVIAAIRKPPPSWRGVVVDRASQPQLWQFIDSLADACRVEAPTRIVITGEVNAVAESSAALFGTLRRDRTIYLGLPLLAVLDNAQAAAVVCHELGHHARGDSRSAALTYRSGDALLSILRRGRMRALGWLTQGLFGAFAGIYFSVTMAVRRKQEFGADQLAARVAGAEATATALEALPLVDAAHMVYLQSGTAAGSADSSDTAAARIADPVGFREFFESITIRLAPDDRKRRADLFDSHPPMVERVVAVRKSGREPGIVIPPGKAIELLHAPGEIARAVSDASRR